MRSIASRYCVAAMNNRRPSAPPKVQFETTAGVGTKPSLRRSADQICTPSAALVHTQPRAIDREAVGIAMVGVAEEAPVGERAAIADVECDDLVLRSGLMSGDFAERQRGVGHIERRAIGGEGEAVGLLEIRHSVQIAGLWIETIHAAMIEFGLGERALVGHDDPEGRIGEPDRAVRRDRDIVGRVDPLALVMCHDGLGLVGRSRRPC